MSGNSDETPAEDRRERSARERRPDHAQGPTPEEDTRERKVNGARVTLTREREERRGGATAKLYKS